MRGLGTHLLVDLYGVAPALLRDGTFLSATFDGALERAGFNVLERVVHQFTSGGEGVTGVFVLSESHLAFHSYPEHGYLALDLFCCGSADPDAVLVAAERAFAAESQEIVIHERGRRIERTSAKGVASRPSLGNLVVS